MDILRILEELNEQAVLKPKSFGPFTYGLNKDEIGMLIVKVRASLPTELKVAAQTVRESGRIVETAKEDAQSAIDSGKKEAQIVLDQARIEADRIIAQAKLEQDKMLSESEIIKISKAQSEEIRLSAEREATQLRRGSEEYSYQVLSQLGTVVEKAMTTIEHGKQALDMAPKEVAVVRERARVG